MNIWNEDCISGSKSRLQSNSIDLMICDPPFGINETEFDVLYKRKEEKVIGGYVEAPADYTTFTFQWMEEAHRVLKESGTFYVISGWTHLIDILNSGRKLDLMLLNHAIWKFNFGVNTTRKFVTSHYHILRFSKTTNVTFNTHCRFGPQEKSPTGGSLLYQDLEDVFTINKEFQHDGKKNENKLPEELIQKLVLYSSNENDLVCDFFMGNFTTAEVAHGLGREVTGFELNSESFNYWYPIISQKKYGWKLSSLKQVSVEKPKNAGKSITDDERKSICRDFLVLIQSKSKKETIEILMKRYGRGKFSIINIVESVSKTSMDNPFIG